MSSEINMPASSTPLMTQNETQAATSLVIEGAKPTIDDIAIRVSNLSKCYHIYDRPEDRLKQSIVPRLQRLAGRQSKNYFREFWALKDVSFEVKKGETVGIIGRNGSGKSTLLQIICGTLAPTSGSVETNGRIAALLELGSGFNPEFTGRENVYMNGAVLGLSKEEIDARYDEIANFAGIGDFLEQPIKTYSSGMHLRLAFAVAVCIDPDILVVDEALAVGDEAFQKKCFSRIEKIQEKGGTILFVSHSAQTIVQLCTRAMLFDTGELILQGDPKEIINQYQRLVNLDRDKIEPVRTELKRIGTVDTCSKGFVDRETKTSSPSADIKLVEICERDYLDPSMEVAREVRYQNRGATITNLRILNGQSRQVNVISSGYRYRVAYDVIFAEDVEDIAFGFLIATVSGLTLAGVGTSRSPIYRLSRVSAGSIVSVEFDFECRLTVGTYFVTAGVSAMKDGDRNYLDRVIDGAVFKVSPEQDQIATGYFDLDIKPSFRVVEAVQDH